MTDPTPWAAPDSAAEPASPVRPHPTASGTTFGPRKPTSGVTALTARTPTEIADMAFAYLRSNFGRVAATVGALVVPFSLLAAFAQRSLLEGESFIEVVNSSDPTLFLGSGNSGADAAAQIIAFVGPSIGLVFVAAAMARLMVASLTGDESVTAGAALAAAGRVAPALLVSWIAVHVVEAIATIAFVVPGFLAMTAFQIVAPVIAVERLGPFAAMKRSTRLVRSRFGASFGVALITVAVSSIVGSALSLVPTAIAGIVGFDIGWIIVGAGSAAISLVTVPFVALTSVLLYLDLRVRSEGLDLELRARDLFTGVR